MTLEPSARSGVYVVVDSHELPVVATARGQVTVADTPEVDPRLPRRTARDGRSLVDVSAEHVDRLLRRTVMATWEGHDVRVVGPLTGETLAVEWEGGPTWPTSVGLDGDQYEGWHGRAPRSELTDLRTVEADIPLRSR